MVSPEADPEPDPEDDPPDSNDDDEPEASLSGSDGGRVPKLYGGSTTKSETAPRRLPFPCCFGRARIVAEKQGQKNRGE